MKTNKQTMLITGGAGMVGSHSAEYFSKKYKKVVIYDNLMRSKIFSSKEKSVEYNWNYLKQYKNIDFIKKDIRDTKSLNETFKKYKPDVVIHTAGQPGVKASVINPLEDFSINCTGTLNCLEALKNNNPDGLFLYTSTNKVYGDNVNKIPVAKKGKRYIFVGKRGVSETYSTDLTGHTPYGVSKLGGDLYVQDYAHTYGLRTGVFRMSCIYGTRQFGFEDQGWVAWFSIRFLQGRPITIFGDGKQVRDVLWVEDLVQAFDKYIQSKHQCEVINLGGGIKNSLSLLELVDLLEEITKTKIKVNFDDWRKFDQKVFISDISKAKKLLNWQPTVNVKQGVGKIVEWVKANPKLFTL